jgi:apolipoprotein N-acyltransferase
LPVLSAIFLLFSFPPFNFSLSAWIALVPLFVIPKDLSLKKTFILYYSSGLIFWCGHIWWLNYVTSLGYVFLSAYLALFLGFFGLFLKLFREKIEYPLLFIAPPLWIMFEFMRTHFLISFPWSLLGYSQWQNIPLIQISSATGVYGVSFLIVMLNAAIADLILSAFAEGHGCKPVNASYKNKKSFFALLFSILIVACVSVYGLSAILPNDGARGGKEIKISVIQGDIPQNIKWSEEYSHQIVNTYAQLSIYAGIDPDISLIVWPETSYPDYVDTESELFEKVKNLTDYLNVPLLVGAVTSQNNENYNSALLISSGGEIKQTYNKLRLVQFAEYIPLKKFLSFLGNIFPQIGAFSKGDEYTIFQTPITDNRKPSFAVLICFEDLFPDLARNFTNEGAQFFVVITNDAHFKESSALWQHFTHSIFRAIENRRPIVRAANNGVSGFIDCYGRPFKILRENGKILGVRGYATAQIISSDKKTFYTRFGDLFVYINIIYLVVLLIIMMKKDSKKL